MLAWLGVTDMEAGRLIGETWSVWWHQLIGLWPDPCGRVQPPDHGYQLPWLPAQTHGNSPEVSGHVSGRGYSPSPSCSVASASQLGSSWVLIVQLGMASVDTPPWSCAGNPL